MFIPKFPIDKWIKYFLLSQKLNWKLLSLTSRMNHNRQLFLLSQSQSIRFINNIVGPNNVVSVGNVHKQVTCFALLEFCIPNFKDQFDKLIENRYLNKLKSPSVTTVWENKIHSHFWLLIQCRPTTGPKSVTFRVR